MYQRGVDPLQPAWNSWQMSSYENPHIPSEELDELCATLPEKVVQQEIQAMFLDDAGGVFRKVMARATGEYLTGPLKGRQYLAGVDVATLEDFTVVTVWDLAKRKMVYMDRFNRVDYTILEDRLEALYKFWGLGSMIIEANSIGLSVIQKLVERDLTIIPFTTTNASKQVIVQELQAAFEHNSVEVLNDQILINELQSFEGKRTPGGLWTYSAPAGQHDDCVMSTAIGFHGLEKPTGADLIGYGDE